jgi:hypothetical protein
MLISLRSVRGAAAGALGAGALAGAMLFGGTPVAEAAPAPAPATSFTMAWPNGTPGGPAVIPTRGGFGGGGHGGWGGGHGGWGHGGGGRGGWDHGGWGRGGWGHGGWWGPWW